MKGKIRLNIFGKFSNVYKKYTLKLCPSSDTKSKKLTACTTQTIKPILSGRVLHKLNGCEPQQTTNNCGKYGNYIRTKQDINGSTGATVYYKVVYGNLRNGSINVGEDITVFEIFNDTEDIGIMGNTGVSTGTHLHIEIRRGVKNSAGKVVEHILNPRNVLPMFIDNN